MFHKKTLFKSVSLCVIILFLVTAGFGQEETKLDTYTLKLRSRTITPDPGINPEFRSKIIQKMEEELAVHVFIQLFKLPSLEEKTKLEKDGLVILSSQGGNSYTATIRNRKIIDPKLLSNIRWIGEILVTDKLQPEVQLGQFGNWTMDRDGIRLRITFFQDVSREEALYVVREYTKADTSVDEKTWKIVIDSTRIRQLAGEDIVQYIEQEPCPLEPLNDITRRIIKSEDIQGINIGNIPATYNGLSGAGIQIGIMDTGIDRNNDDFFGRIIRFQPIPVIEFRQSPAGYHGTHVAGTVAGSGILSNQNDLFRFNNGGLPYQWRGHAPQSEIAAYPLSWDWGIYLDAIENFKVDVTNHSHTQSPDFDYSSDAINVDLITRNRQLYVCTAAGNNGDDRRNNSVLIGYFSITGSKAKNSILVGNYNTAKGIKDQSSSMGPTFDGRLKPDIVAPGTIITSSDFAHRYNSRTGTSMAAPAVTGTIALMLESYFKHLPAGRPYSPGGSTRIPRPLNSTIKAILIHTAHDLVQDPAMAGEPNNIDTKSPVIYHKGPDWATGYGLIDAAAATELIANAHAFLEDQINFTGQENSHSFNIFKRRAELKVTIAWDDPPGSILTAHNTPKLVNDLDLILISPNGTIHEPYILPPLTPETPGTIFRFFTGIDPISVGDIVSATTGTDHLNNVEQILVENPIAGLWTIKVRGYAIRAPVQKYSLVSFALSNRP